MGLTKSNIMKKPEFKIETSWDDGNVLDMKLASILQRYKLPAVFYIIVERVGEPGYLTWDNIKVLENAGFEIGSHTMSHPTDMKLLHDEQLHYEVQNSKDMLEAVVGHSILKFCYPRGRYDDRVQRKVAEAGYVEARTTGTPGILEVKDKLAVPGTIHIFQRKEYGELSILEYAISVIDKAKAKGGYVNIWGHSWEIDRDKNWGVLEKILSYAGN